MPSNRKLIALGVVLAVAVSGIALAQNTPEHHSMGPDQQQMMESGQHPMGQDQMQEMMRQHQGTMPMGGHPGMHTASTTPTMPGQDAFGAIQEIVQILEADQPKDRLVQGRTQRAAAAPHRLNEVTLRADVDSKQVEGGLEIAVTGSGRTLIAIQRMVSAWAQTMNGHQGWSTKAAALPNGELLTVTAADPKEVQHIRGLGFIGLLVSGSMHQPHHLAMAKGEFADKHLGHTH